MSLRKEEIEIIGSQNKCPFSVVEVYQCVSHVQLFVTPWTIMSQLRLFTFIRIIIKNTPLVLQVFYFVNFWMYYCYYHCHLSLMEYMYFLCNMYTATQSHRQLACLYGTHFCGNILSLLSTFWLHSESQNLNPRLSYSKLPSKGSLK